MDCAGRSRLRVLVANGQNVALGDSAVPMQMAKKIKLAHHDLLYLVPIVSAALEEIGDEVLKGICPECPYPER